MSSKKPFILVVLLLTTIGITVMSFKGAPVDHNTLAILPKDSIGSVKAFMSVYKVLKSARCMNCHPSGDVPLQGDDNHLHTMGVKRGPDGKGLHAMKCSNCHQAENARAYIHLREIPNGAYLPQICGWFSREKRRGSLPCNCWIPNKMAEEANNS